MILIGRDANAFVVMDYFVVVNVPVAAGVVVGYDAAELWYVL